jgi:hypothetical protein
METHAKLVSQLQQQLKDKDTQLNMATAKAYVAGKLPERKAWHLFLDIFGCSHFSHRLTWPLSCFSRRLESIHKRESPLLARACRLGSLLCSWPCPTARLTAWLWAGTHPELLPEGGDQGHHGPGEDQLGRQPGAAEEGGADEQTQPNQEPE